MIVRIATEGQYRLSSALLDQLNEMDDALVHQIAEYDEAEFRERFAALLSLVREQGEKVGDDELMESHVILPSPDISVGRPASSSRARGCSPTGSKPTRLRKLARSVTSERAFALVSKGYCFHERSYL